MSVTLSPRFTLYLEGLSRTSKEAIEQYKIIDINYKVLIAHIFTIQSYEGNLSHGNNAAHAFYDNYIFGRAAYSACHSFIHSFIVSL